MKKLIYFLIALFSINIVTAITLEENTTYNPEEGGYNVTYRMNKTFEGLTVVEVNETCLTINTTTWCNSSATDKIINISEILIDITAPIITNLRNTSTTNGSSFIEWNCDENCNYSIYIFNNTVRNNSYIFDILHNSTFAMSHNPYWGNLSNSTTYWINLTVKDNLGQATSNNTFNFTTAVSVTTTFVLKIVDYGIEWVKLNFTTS